MFATMSSLAVSVLIPFGLSALVDSEPNQTASVTAAHPDRPLPNTVRITRRTDGAALTPSNKVYTVQCRLVLDKVGAEATGSRSAKKQIGRDGQLVNVMQAIAFPAFTVRDGEKVTLADTIRTSRVIAYKPGSNPRIPITREINEGTTVECTVIGAEVGSAVVDVSVDLESSGEQNPEPGTVRVNALKGRLIRSVPLGTKVMGWLNTASDHPDSPWAIEVTVHEARGDKLNAQGRR